MAFSWAAAPDMMLQQAKDAQVVDRLHGQLQRLAARLCGAAFFEDWAPEFAAAAQLLYFVVTRIGGGQTLGEEYTDLQVVVPIAAANPASNAAGISATRAQLGTIRVPSSRHLTGLAFLSILTPYAFERLQRASAAFAMEEDALRRREERRRGRRHYRRRHHLVDADNGQKNDGSTLTGRALFTACQLWREVRRRFWGLVASCLQPTSHVAMMAVILSQVHRMLFFMRGDHSTVAMRVMGIRQIFNRDLDEGRASYSILGLLLLVRLMLATGKQLCSVWVALRTSRLFGAQQEVGAGRNNNINKYNNMHEEEDDERRCAEILVPSCKLVKNGVGKEDDSSLTSSASSEALMCPLCADNITHPTLTPCGHVFCWDCVVPWCERRSMCPLCRQSSPPQTLLALYFHGQLK